jgi:hypothetical protein
VITDEQVEKALNYLRDTAPEAAVARSQAKTMDKYLGVVEAKAKAMATGDGMSNAASQDWARSTEEYKTTLDAWTEAVRRDCEFTMLREAAASRIEAWRTMSSNERAGMKVG